MQKWGIDVSRWQGDFNWKKAKDEGVQFGIVKCGGSDDGYYTDKKFLYNCSESWKYGFTIGAYYFGNASNTNEAKKEAEHCISILKGHRFSYPIYYDVESSRMNVGKDNLDKIIRTFCETMENAGYFVGFYMNYDWYCNKCHGAELAKRFTAWIASWSKVCPIKCDMWQFGGETNLIRSNKVTGITVDQNYCYRDFPTEIKGKYLNGFTKAETVSNTTLKVGDKIKLASNATYYDGTIIPSWVLAKTLYLRSIDKNIATVSILKEGAITGVVDTRYIIKA